MAVQTNLGPEVTVETGLVHEVVVEADDLDDNSYEDFNANTDEEDNHFEVESSDPNATDEELSGYESDDYVKVAKPSDDELSTEWEDGIRR